MQEYMVHQLIIFISVSALFNYIFSKVVRIFSKIASKLSYTCLIIIDVKNP